MTSHEFLNEDLEKFAEHMGFEGADIDLFYESYYQLQDEHDDYDVIWENPLQFLWLWVYYLKDFRIGSLRPRKGDSLKSTT